jgi:hypothetical protein
MALNGGKLMSAVGFNSAGAESRLCYRVVSTDVAHILEMTVWHAKPSLLRWKRFSAVMDRTGQMAYSNSIVDSRC